MAKQQEWFTLSCLLLKAKQADTLYTPHKVQGQLCFVPTCKVAWNCSSLLCVWEGSFIRGANSALLCRQSGRGEQALGYRQHPPLHHAGPLSHGGSPSFRKQGRVCRGAERGRALYSFITRTCLIWKDAFLILCSAHESL